MPTHWHDGGLRTVHTNDGSKKAASTQLQMKIIAIFHMRRENMWHITRELISELHMYRCNGGYSKFYQARQKLRLIEKFCISFKYAENGGRKWNWNTYFILTKRNVAKLRACKWKPKRIYAIAMLCYMCNLDE